MKCKLTYIVLLFFSFYSFAQGKLTFLTIENTSKSISKELIVYLPEGYENSNKKYPVLYMHDAQNLFLDSISYAGEWRIDETLDSLKAKIIVVGIYHGNEKRVNELTPFKNEKYGGGEANAYLDFLVNTIKPTIDSRFRTKKNKQNTFILGSSLGGLTSFYAALKYPKVFAASGVFSPSFWYSKEIYTYANNHLNPKTRFYFMCGEAESDSMVLDMKNMTDLIRNNAPKLDFFSRTVPNGMHNEKLWANEFAKAYLWLLKN